MKRPAIFDTISHTNSGRRVHLPRMGERELPICLARLLMGVQSNYAAGFQVCFCWEISSFLSISLVIRACAKCNYLQALQFGGTCGVSGKSTGFQSAFVGAQASSLFRVCSDLEQKLPSC